MKRRNFIALATFSGLGLTIASDHYLAYKYPSWKIVSGHHPLYSSGYYGTNLELIKRLEPLFARYRVQLYLNGHEHHYERTKPIKGTTYLTCGTGGAELRPVGKSDWTDFSVSQWSFAAIEVYPERLEICGIDTDGNIFDRATLLQQLST